MPSQASLAIEPRKAALAVVDGMLHREQLDGNDAKAGELHDRSRASPSRVGPADVPRPGAELASIRGVKRPFIQEIT